MNVFFSEFFLALSLIAAIGVQNAFVLRQGVQWQHIFAVCLTCAVSDTILVTAGIIGFGALVTAMPRIEMIMTLAGVCFLAVYGMKSFRAAFTDQSALKPADMKTVTLFGTIAACLAFTWLNPHMSILIQLSRWELSRQTTVI